MNKLAPDPVPRPAPLESAVAEAFDAAVADGLDLPE